MINKLFQQLAKHVDSFLMTCLIFTLLIGLFVLYSASGQNYSRLFGQVINIIIALSFMWVAANIAPNQLERVALPLYVLGVLLLICVALFGSVSHGARRWLSLGFTQIQPSEIMRIAMPMMLAWYFSQDQ